MGFIDWDIAFITKTIIALCCGFSIGLERQIKGKPMGIRTSIIICFSTMLFVYLAILMDENECIRVLGQLITGVGFLGAGVIINREGLVTGLTSACVVWVLAAIGACIGFGEYSMAVISSGVVLGVLIGVQKLESIFKELGNGIYRKTNNTKTTDDII